MTVPISRSSAGLLVILYSVGLCGCGNQMFRQASYAPLDTPRASPPVGSIPVRLTDAPDDAQPVISNAYGGSDAAAAIGSASLPEPNLPPANLRDNAVYVAAPKSVDTVAPPFRLTDANLIESGKTVFLNRCVQCHDATGYGYGVVGSYLQPHPPDLASRVVQKRSNGAIFWAITSGIGKMPAFRAWTTPLQRWALTAYVKNLKPKAGAAHSAGEEEITDTSGATYPIYGEAGFESGKNVSPFKALGEPKPPSDSRVYDNQSEPVSLPNSAPE